MFVFKIGHKLIENEARKDDLVSSQNNRIYKKKKKKKKKKGRTRTEVLMASTPLALSVQSAAPGAAIQHLEQRSASELSP